MTLTAATIGLIGLTFLFLTFNLAGGETLGQIESKNIVQLIITTLILIIAIFSARRYIKSSKKYSAYGIVAIPLLLFLATTAYYFDNNIYDTKFDKTVWKQSNPKPEKMAKTLVKENSLMGMTNAQIKEMLGDATEEYWNVSSESGSILYSVKNNWTLVIILKHNKVLETKLRLPYLGV